MKLAGDLPEVRPRYVNVSKRLTNPDLSPSGVRAVFEARGEIITVPADRGESRNLTNTTAVMEREPVWSPDGHSIAYFSDESGEYALHIRNQDGTGEVKKIALAKAFYLSPRWSPDKKIAFMDNHAHLFYMDLADQKPTLVDTDYYYNHDGMAPSWSPDGKWLAYSKTLRNHFQAVFFYSLADRKPVQVTDGMSDAQSPVFDKSGKYLFFIASTNSGAAMQPDIEAFARPVTASVYAIVLSKSEPSPLAPQSDEEKKKDEPKKDDTKKDEPKKEEARKEETKPDTIIDLDNISQRILSIPMPPRRYASLQVGKSGIVFATVEPAPGAGGPGTLSIGRHDLNKRKADVLITGLRYFKTSFNGEKILYQQGDKWAIADLPPNPDSGPTPPPPNEKSLKIQDLEVKADPPAEWRQMFHETWRIERDFFYDPNLHGLDAKAAEERYGVYLDRLGSREDLNYLFVEMLGNITVGHMFVGGGDHPDVKRIPTGLLGADYKIENGRYRFVRIYNGENWDPDLRAPLTQPGVKVVAGEYLLAVNGRDLVGTDNIYSFFEATAGKTTTLRVGSDPSGTNAREVEVTPLNNESQIRHLAWMKTTAAKSIR